MLANCVLEDWMNETAPIPCPACMGNGNVDGAKCWQCDGAGVIEQAVMNGEAQQ